MKSDQEPKTSGENSFKGAFDIVALAASAGGLRAISEILTVLPSDFLAAIVVVQHLDPRHRSLMADILSRRTTLKVREAQEGAQLNPGTTDIYCAGQQTFAGQSRWHAFSISIGTGPFRASLGRSPL
jgi:chemotaxis response regulator CheB